MSAKKVLVLTAGDGITPFVHNVGGVNVHFTLQPAGYLGAEVSPELAKWYAARGEDYFYVGERAEHRTPNERMWNRHASEIAPLLDTMTAADPQIAASRIRRALESGKVPQVNQQIVGEKLLLAEQAAGINQKARRKKEQRKTTAAKVKDATVQFANAKADWEAKNDSAEADDIDKTAALRQTQTAAAALSESIAANDVQSPPNGAQDYQMFLPGGEFGPETKEQTEEEKAAAEAAAAALQAAQDGEKTEEEKAAAEAAAAAPQAAQDGKKKKKNKGATDGDHN